MAFIKKLQDRRGERWSPGEDREFINEIMSGLSDLEIAEKHKRSEIAIYLRKCGFACKEIKAGADSKQILEKYKLSEAELEKYYNDQQERTKINEAPKTNDLEKRVSDLEKEVAELKEQLSKLLPSSTSTQNNNKSWNFFS